MKIFELIVLWVYAALIVLGCIVYAVTLQWTWLVIIPLWVVLAFFQWRNYTRERNRV